MIPPNAKRVFKGITNDVYQWPQKLFDGTSTTFERIKRPDSAKVIPVLDGKIVFTNEEQPAHGTFYNVVGGRMDDGETPLESAKRELLEENGLVSDDWDLIKEYRDHNGLEWNIHLFVARNCQKERASKNDAGEKIKVKTGTWNEFVKVVKSPQFRLKCLSLDFFQMSTKKLNNLKEHILK